MSRKSKMAGDTSVMTYKGHCVLHTLVRCRFSPQVTTSQRYIYSGCATGCVVSKCQHLHTAASHCTLVCCWSLWFWISFQPVPHDWCNKGCVMVHIKEPLLLVGKSNPCGCSRFPLSLSEWSFTIYLTP